MKSYADFIRRFKTQSITLLILLTIFVPFFSRTAIVKVNFNMTGRPESEVNEPGCIAWPFDTAASTVQSFSTIAFTLTNEGANGTNVRSNWYKAGIKL